MRILIFNHYASPPDQPLTSAYDLASSLVRRGHKVTILASSFSHYRFKELRLGPTEKCKLETFGGVDFLWLRTFPYRCNNWRRIVNMLSFAWRALMAAREMNGTPDVVVGATVHPLAALSAYLFARSRGAPFVFEVRDLWPLTLVQFGRLPRWSPVTWGMSGLERFLCIKAKYVITVVPGGAEYFEKIGVSRNKVAWIPNGLNTDRYLSLKPYDGSVGRPLLVMYVGGHVNQFALEAVLEAARLIQEAGGQAVRFVFVGSGQEKPRLMKVSKSLELRNVEWRDVVPKDQLPGLMAKADVFILGIRELPGLYQYGVSFNKLCDYMAAGRPIIFAGNPGYNAVEKAQAGIVVPPERPEAIVKAIEQFLALTPEERRQMGQNGQRYVKEHHDIRILTDKMEAVLLAAVSEHGGPSAERVKAAPSRPPDQSELHEVARGGSKNGQ